MMFKLRKATDDTLYELSNQGRLFVRIVRTWGKKVKVEHRQLAIKPGCECGAKPDAGMFFDYCLCSNAGKARSIMAAGNLYASER